MLLLALNDKYKNINWVRAFGSETFLLCKVNFGDIKSCKYVYELLLFPMIKIDFIVLFFVLFLVDWACYGCE